MDKKRFLNLFSQCLADNGVTTGEEERKIFVEKFFKTLAEVIVSEEKIKFDNIGRFEMKRPLGKRIRNPKTGGKMVSCPKPVVKFYMSNNSRLKNINIKSEGEKNEDR